MRKSSMALAGIVGVVVGARDNFDCLRFLAAPNVRACWPVNKLANYYIVYTPGRVEGQSAARLGNWPLWWLMRVPKCVDNLCVACKY